MNAEPTLIDLALRESLKPHNAAVPATARDMLLAARKFVLDQQMSAYIADLSNAAFAANPTRHQEIADGARRLARLPHAITWIEYDCRARVQRSHDAYPETHRTSTLFSIEEVITRVGWLLVRHPKIETAFTLTEIAEDNNGRAMMLPYSYTWVSDDQSVLPWRNLPLITTTTSGRERDAVASEIATGIIGYRTDRVGISLSLNANRFQKEGLGEMLRETVGELRAVWTLLATINDLPTTFNTVRPTKGYVARGRYRRFVEHSVIHLHVPEHRSLRTLAARAVATVRRRAHQVRGHFRKDWRHPAAALCEHQWETKGTAVECKLCHGKRLWISEHQRGDAGRGFVIHDYEVHHDKEKRK